MESIKRIYDLEINLSSVSTIKTKIRFKQYDYNASFINILYHSNGDLINNIKNNTVIGVFKNPNDELIIDAETNKPVQSLARTTSNGNIITLSIPKEVLKHSGNITCETIILMPNNKRLTSPAFVFAIEPSLLDIDVEFE